MMELKAWCVAWHQKNQKVGRMAVVMAEDEAGATEEIVDGADDIEVADVRLLTWRFHDHMHTFPWSHEALLKCMVRRLHPTLRCEGYDEVLLAVAAYRCGFVRDPEAEALAALEERARGGDSEALRQLTGR